MGYVFGQSGWALGFAVALFIALLLRDCGQLLVGCCEELQTRGFGVPTLIAVHPENDPNGDGLEIAKAYAAATGGDRAGERLRRRARLE